jgi:hypothetical protein
MTCELHRFGIYTHRGSRILSSDGVQAVPILEKSSTFCQNHNQMQETAPGDIRTSFIFLTF